MGLICSRIGCREKAAASLQFDAARSTAVLIDLTHARHGMPLCERHASSRTAPVGWQLVDRRTGARKMEMWTAEDEAGISAGLAPPTERPSTRRPADPPTRRAEDRMAPAADPADPEVARPTERPATRRPVDAPEPAPVTEVAEAGAPAEEDGTHGFRWPRHDADTDETDEGLTADSPLLSRAFRAAK